MEGLTLEINEMLDDIVQAYETDTGRRSNHELIISGLIKNKHVDLFGK